MNFNFLYKYIMKTLKDHQSDFLKEASEYDLGKKQEDFHSYLRHHNLDHLYLSETQKQDRQMASNGLNAMGIVSGIAVPMTLGAMFGLQKLTSNIIGHGEHSGAMVRDIDSLTGRTIDYPITAADSISGYNTRPMPHAPSHIGQDLFDTAGFIPYPPDYVPTQKEAVDNAVNIANVALGRKGGMSSAGLFPPTQN